MYDSLIPDHDTPVEIVCGQGTLLNLIADDVAGLKINDHADDNINENNAEDDHTDI